VSAITEIPNFVLNAPPHHASLGARSGAPPATCNTRFRAASPTFCVLRVKARGQGDLMTFVGHAAMISAGEFVRASGSWTNDRTHRVQFRASFLQGDGTDYRRKWDLEFESGLLQRRVTSEPFLGPGPPSGQASDDRGLLDAPK
jgi:hypothetical protein